MWKILPLKLPIIRNIGSPDEIRRFMVDMTGRPAPTYHIIEKGSVYPL